MLSDGQSQDVVLGGQGEPEPAGVVTQHLLVDQLQRVLGVWVQQGPLLPGAVKVDLGQQGRNHHRRQAQAHGQVLKERVQNNVE